MKANRGWHLTYCCNVQRGDTWPETLAKLEQNALALRQRVCPDGPFGLTLRLSGAAARALSDPATLRDFHRWLNQHQCYVTGIQGFPCGHLRDRLVAAQVFVPDWTSPERLAYTNVLLDILAQLLPPDAQGCVGTMPGAVKGVDYAPEELRLMRNHLWRCLEHAERLSERSGRTLRLALEPGPYCLLETSGEVIEFFHQLSLEHMNDSRLREFLTVTYDACHFAVEFEQPAAAIGCLRQHGIRLGKVQFSVAPRVCPVPEVCQRLGMFKETAYQHQVVALCRDGSRVLYRSLAQALAQAERNAMPEVVECRIHMHIPLHGPDGEWFVSSTDHVLELLDLLAVQPELCANLEIETQTWDTLPPEMRQRPFADLMAAEYAWLLERMADRGLVQVVAPSQVRA